MSARATVNILFCLLGLLGLPGPAQATAQTPDADILEPALVTLAVKDSGALGAEAAMVTQVFKPKGDGPFPVLLFSHGRSSERLERLQLKRPIPGGHVRYWVNKGFAVVAPIRPGYGDSGSHDVEDSGSRFDYGGHCTSKPDFARVARNASRAARTALDWVREQPWAAKDHIVLAGQSVGGLTTVALAASNPPGVLGYINFAGGAGGNPVVAPGKSCGPRLMAELMAELGKTTRLPSLWLYAENDLYWGTDVPKQWHAAFASGGSPSQFVMTLPVPNADGHALLARGGRLWSVHIERFVSQLGL